MKPMLRRLLKRKLVIWSSPVFIGVLVGLLIISTLPRAVTPEAGSSGSAKLEVTKKIFGAGEQPVLNLSVGAPRVAWWGVGTAEAAEKVTTEVTYDGHKVDVPVAVKAVGSGKYELKLEPESDIKPGKYTVTAKWGSEPHESATQTFAWGVLSINTTRPSYLPGETAEIHMGVLSSTGHTLCAAPVTLKIFAPDGQEEMPVVRNSPVCKGDTYVTEPDYVSSYKTSGAGNYRMVLRMADTDYEMEAGFEVRESLPFTIERTAPTRLFPPATYVSVIKVTAHQDFKGTITERLPAGFTASNAPGAMIDGTKLSWPAEMKMGETYNFTYSFKAPDKSPAFYELSRLSFRTGAQTAYQESRSWQMAGDAVISFVKQTVVTKTASTSQVVSVTSTSGNTLIAVIGINTSLANDLVSITDTASNTWVVPGTAPATNPPAQYTSSSTSYGAMAYCVNCSAVTSVTFTLNTSKTMHVNISEYSNVTSTSPVDQSNGARSASGTSHTTPTLSTTNADDLIIGAVVTSADVFTRTTANYTDLTGSTISGNVLAAAYRVVSSTGSYSINWSLDIAHGVTTLIMAFKAAADPPLASCGSSSTISFVKQTSVSNLLSTTDLNRALTSTAGNALIMYYQIDSSTETLSSITNSAGNTWVIPGASPNSNPPENATTLNHSGIAYALNIAATTTISVTISASEQFSYTVAEFSGVATASAVDQSSSKNNAAATQSSTNSITTTNANDLIFATYTTNNDSPSIVQASSTPTSGWTQLDTNTGGVGDGFLTAAYNVVAATGTYQAAFSTTNSVVSVANIIAFKAGTGSLVNMDQVMRGGQAFCSGVKSRFFWAS